jgi:hypothetical protein
VEFVGKLGDDRGWKLTIGGKEGDELTARCSEASPVYPTDPEIRRMMEYPDRRQLHLKLMG